MNEINEALKGFSDLPIAAVSLVFGILAAKREKIKGFSVLFFIISAASVLGAAVHIFSTSKLSYKAIWSVLYLLLYEAARRFSHLFSEYIAGSCTGESKIVIAAELCLYAMTVLCWSQLGGYKMLCLIAFSVLCIGRIVLCIVKSKRLPGKATVLLLLSSVALILQALSGYIPYAIVYEHIVMTVVVVMVYLISTEEITAVEARL